MHFIVMFVTAVCVLFLIKLRWPKKNKFCDAASGNGILSTEKWNLEKNMGLHVFTTSYCPRLNGFEH